MIKNSKLFISVGLAAIIAAAGSIAAIAEEITGETAALEITDSDEGFGCIILEDGTVYWQAGTDSCKTLLSLYGIGSETSYASIHVVPDNDEKYPYLYPEYDWKMLAYKELPDWFGESSEEIVWAAFEEWKEEVYSYFDVVALREADGSEMTSVELPEDYEATEEDIAAMREYAILYEYLPTYMRNAISDTLKCHIGSAIAGDCWDYINEVSTAACQGAKIGDYSHELGVSNSGLQQTCFGACYLGSFFSDTISEWNYYDGTIEGYPYQCAVYLFQHGLIPAQDSDNVWRIFRADGLGYIYEESGYDISPCKAFSCVVTQDGEVYWKAGTDNTDDIRIEFGLKDVEAADIQVKPVLSEETASMPLPDGENPDATRIFPYLDPCTDWTITVLNDADWFESEDAVMEAFEEWREAVYGGLDFEAAQEVFTEEDTELADYSDEDIENLRKWAIAWHNLKDQGLDPTACINMSGHAAVGGSMWDDFYYYLLASWRAVHTGCPGGIVQDAYWEYKGISKEDQSQALGDVIGDCASDAMQALQGYFYSNITDWAYYTGDEEGYPYESCALLMMNNLLPYTDGENWYLCSGYACDVVFEISEEELLAE